MSRYPGWSEAVNAVTSMTRIGSFDRRRRPYQAEYQECIAFASWLRFRGIFFFHYPAGELRPKILTRDRSGRPVTYSPAGKRLRAMGALDGVSDYVIFDRPPADPTKVGVVWEMKALDGALSFGRILFGLMILAIIGMLVMLGGCGQSMISVITQTPPATAPQNFNDYNFVTYAEAARSQWAMKGTSNEVLAMGGALSLAGLSTALLATASQSPIARGIAVGANGLLGVLGVIKPGDRDAAYNTGAGLLLKAESDYILAVRAEGFCTVPVDQMTTAGAQLFAQTNAAIVIVNDLIQGIMEAGFLQAMQQFYGAQLTPQPAKVALKDAAPCK